MLSISVIVVAVLMLIGLFGMIVPIFPGLIIIWLAALAFGIIEGFNTIGSVIFVLITGLMLIGMVVDNIVMGMMIRKEGAAWSSVILGMLAGLIGTIIVPLVGGLVAAPATVVLLEYRRVRNWRKVWLIVRGLALGWSLSFVLQFGIGLVMVLLWGGWVWQMQGLIV